MDSSSLEVCNINHILNNNNHNNNNNNSDISVVWNIPRILHRNKLLQFVNQKLLVNDGCGSCYSDLVVKNNKNNKNSQRRNTSQRTGRTTILNERMKRLKPLPTTTITTTRQYIPPTTTTTDIIPLSLWPHILEQMNQKTKYPHRPFFFPLSVASCLKKNFLGCTQNQQPKKKSIILIIS